MKKTLIVIAVLAAIAAVAVWAIKKKGAVSAADQTPPPPPPPPPQNDGATDSTTIAGLYSTTDGTGGTAVKKRISEISASKPAMSEILASGDYSDNLLKGTGKAESFLRTNIGLSTGAAGLENVPLVLSSSQSNAVEALQKLRSEPGYWTVAMRITNAAAAIKEKTGVAILANDMYNIDNMNPLRNKVFQGIYNPSKKKEDAGAMDQSANLFTADLNTFAANWLAAVEMVKKAITEQAIQDLRGQGWRFMGYDKPV